MSIEKINNTDRPGSDRRELTFDYYPSDRRSRLISRSDIDRWIKSVMPYDSMQSGPNRREMTYDFYPSDRRG